MPSDSASTQSVSNLESTYLVRTESRLACHGLDVRVRVGTRFAGWIHRVTG